MSDIKPKENYDTHKIYAFSHCETWIEDYCKSNNLSFHELASGVANLLQLQTRREISGFEYNMPTLRRKSSTRNKTTRKMEMDGSTHIKASKVTAINKHRVHANRRRNYNGKHWTQDPKNHAKLMRIVNNARRLKKAKAQ